MSDSITSATPADDIAMGAKVISYCVDALGFAAALTIGAQCTSFVMAIIVSAICAVVLMLLASIASFALTMAMKTTHVEAIGRNTNAAIFKIGGLFARAKNAVTPAKVAAA